MRVFCGSDALVATNTLKGKGVGPTMTFGVKQCVCIDIQLPVGIMLGSWISVRAGCEINAGCWLVCTGVYQSVRRLILRELMPANNKEPNSQAAEGSGTTWTRSIITRLSAL